MNLLTNTITKRSRAFRTARRTSLPDKHKIILYSQINDIHNSIKEETAKIFTENTNTRTRSTKQYKL